MRFFFYGTLMDGEVREAVLGPAAARLQVRQARLGGYRRVHAPGQSWPVLVRAAGGQVDGIAADGVDTALARVLLRYEGPDYRLARCRVRLAGGATAVAAVFLPRVAPGAGRPWRYDVWRATARPTFLARLRGARAGGARPTAAGNAR
ncbi:MAG: gamma-glutamylcyclotransferase family protein [Alphaproteobacteria bacterium]